MKRTKFILIVTGLVLLTACSNDEAQPSTDGLPILLTSTVCEQSTRASSGIQNTQLAEGEKVNVYITAVGGGATYDPKTYNVNNEGELSPVGNVYPYFPTNGNSIDLYALYPSTVTNAVTKFTVSSNQDRQAQYKASDLMYGLHVDGDGNKQNIAPTSDKQTITFRHKLSKVTVQLISGTGSPTVTGATIQLCNVFTQVGFTPSSGAVGGTSGETGFVTVTESTSASGNSVSPVSAIIPPQTIGTGYFLKIRLTGGDVVYYSPSQSFDMESGKEYRFNVTINQNTISVNYTVSDWLNTQDVNGDDNNVVTTQTELQP